MAEQNAEHQSRCTDGHHNPTQHHPSLGKEQIQYDADQIRRQHPVQQPHPGRWLLSSRPAVSLDHYRDHYSGKQHQNSPKIGAADRVRLPGSHPGADQRRCQQHQLHHLQHRGLLRRGGLFQRLPAPPPNPDSLPKKPNHHGNQHHIQNKKTPPQGKA